MDSRIDRAIIETAARQHGVVTGAQLIAAGLTDDAVRSRLRARRLVRVHRCVYRLGSLVGPLCPLRSPEMAAVLACARPCAGDHAATPIEPGHAATPIKPGPTATPIEPGPKATPTTAAPGPGGPAAAVGHRSALWLLDLVPARPQGAVHVVVAGRRCRQAGMVAHRVATLPATDVEAVDGIPTTTPIRSILDFAADARPRDLEQVIARAERQGRLDLDALRARVRCESGRRGVALLRAILAGPEPAFTRSHAEDELLRLVREARFPEPRCNVTVHGFEVDLFWPRHGVVVEVDGFAHHGSRSPFERDRDRSFDLAAHGIETYRVTWRHITEQPHVIVRRLAAVLARADVRREAEARRGARSPGGRTAERGARPPGF